MSTHLGFFILLLVRFVTSQSSFNYDNDQAIHFSFRGLMAPVFTPFNNDANRTLNLSVIPEYAKLLVSKNITGILVGGTTGEGTSLSIDERKRLVEAWANVVKETKQHLMVQIGGAALIDVKELAAHAEDLHVDSLLCLPDLYFKPSTTEDLIEYLSEVGKSAPNTPLLYYQSTKAKVNVKTGDLLKSVGKRIPTLVGVKLDSSDVKDGVEALAANSRFAVIYGSKMVIVAGCAIGVDTFMTATLSFIPEPALKLLEFCNGYTDLKTAQKNQNALNKIENEILQYGGYVETMKTAMSLITNLFMGPPRSPLKPLTRENVEAMLLSLSKLGFKPNASAMLKKY